MFSLRTLAVAAVAGGTLLASAGTALAYPGVPANASGSCSPATQTAAIGAGFAGVTCTFTFLDDQGQPVANKPFVPGVTGASMGLTSTATNGAGQATVAISEAACSSVGTTNAIVTGAVNGVSTQAVSSFTCGKQHVDISGACTLTAAGAAPDLGTGHGDVYSCVFTTNPTGVFNVAYALNGANSLLRKSQSQTGSNGQATATVWDYDGGAWDLDATVRTTSTVDGGSTNVHP